ncbi:MAG: excinuclease ABC subunit UvrA, partial [Planctomycetaceae bacterium]
ESELYVIVDRLTAGKTTDERLADSLELAFREGDGRCVVLEDESASGRNASTDAEIMTIDGREWRVHRFDGRLVCDGCGRAFLEPEPRLFSFHLPLGACPECRGFGSVPAVTFERVVPDPSKTLREGAIVPWTTPAYRHELEELLALADDYGIPADVPFSELQPPHLDLIREGVPERSFGGLRGFFRWLERHKSKLSVAVFLSRWRTYDTCPACRGDRLRPEALAVRIAGRNIADVCRASIDESLRWFNVRVPVAESSTPQRSAIRDCAIRDCGFADSATGTLSLTPTEREVTKTLLGEIRARLGYLRDVGLGYLSLDRTMKTLSSGEVQRVALTGTLG